MQQEKDILFSKSCEYAIRAVIYIAQQSAKGIRVGIKDISADTDSPEPFIAKILQQLTRPGVVSSAKGPNGGFYVTDLQADLPLMSVVLAIDGEKLFVGCGLGLKTCSETTPCPVHHEFKIIREGLKQMLEQTTITALCRKVNSGQSYLTIEKIRR